MKIYYNLRCLKWLTFLFIFLKKSMYTYNVNEATVIYNKASNTTIMLVGRQVGTLKL